MLQMIKYALLLTFIVSNFASAYPKGDESEEYEETKNETVYDNYRLPSSIKPENYKLEIFTHLNDSEGFIFKGIVAITVRFFFYIIYDTRLYLNLLSKSSSSSR